MTIVLFDFDYDGFELPLLQSTGNFTMNLHLEGKRAFVSGSSSGIGAGIARKLAQEGAIVVVHGRSEEKAHRVGNEIGQSSGHVFVALGDLSTDEGAVSCHETGATVARRPGHSGQQCLGTDEWAEIERRAVKEIVPNSVARIGRADDIANAVAFLASPLADYIDGANLRVDGGYVAAIN